MTVITLEPWRRAVDLMSSHQLAEFIQQTLAADKAQLLDRILESWWINRLDEFIEASNRNDKRLGEGPPSPPSPC